MNRLLTVAICCVFSFYFQSFASGQSSVITLIFPSGARTLGMGEVGTALADDEQALFYNPAGLGIENYRWDGGAITDFYEPLLPAFKIPDLWHKNYAFCLQPAQGKLGGLSINYNYINFGTNEITDDSGTILGSARNYEWVLSTGGGIGLKKIGLDNHYIGASAKFIYSALAPVIGSNGQGTVKSVAFDVGYIWNFLPPLRLGVTLTNIGPSIHYMTMDEQVPIPFTGNIALAYKDYFFHNGTNLIGLSTEARISKEMVKNRPTGPDPFWQAVATSWETDSNTTMQRHFDDINMNVGVDITLLNTFSFRQGFLIDKAGGRYESHFGSGIRCFNHFQFDWYIVNSPEGHMAGIFGKEGSNGTRDGQWGMSVTMYRMFNWQADDMKWWKQKS